MHTQAANTHSSLTQRQTQLVRDHAHGWLMGGALIRGGGSLLTHSKHSTTPHAKVVNVAMASRAHSSETQLPVQPVVISGPSGAGKSTLLKKAMNEFPGVFGLSVSHTTRKPRDGEQHGREYNFVSREEMLKRIDEDEFVEHAQFGGNIYGTSRKAIQDVARSNRVCVLDLEMQGCESIRCLPEFSPLFIFVQPPSLEALENRLRARNSETEETLAKRMAEAKAALEYGCTPGKFDVVVVNDDLDRAYDTLRTALLPKVKEVRELQGSQQ